MFHVCFDYITHNSTQRIKFTARICILQLDIKLSYSSNRRQLKFNQICWMNRRLCVATQYATVKYTICEQGGCVWCLVGCLYLKTLAVLRANRQQICLGGFGKRCGMMIYVCVLVMAYVSLCAGVCVCEG